MFTELSPGEEKTPEEGSAGPVLEPQEKFWNDEHFCTSSSVSSFVFLSRFFLTDVFDPHRL